MNNNVILNAVADYTANKNQYNINNYHCSIDDNGVITGGKDNYYGSLYFKSPVVSPLREATTWEIQVDFQYISGLNSNPTVFGTSSSNIYDCPIFDITSSKFRIRIPRGYNTWLYDVTTNLTATDGQWYRFKIGKTNDFTYYIDYKLKTNDVWASDFTRLWEAQPIVNNKNMYCVTPFMFLNNQTDLSAYCGLSKIDLNNTKVYINGDIYWSAISEFAIDDIVYCNKGFAQTGEDVIASHLIDYLKGNCTELGKVTAVTENTVTVSYKSQGQSTISPYENNSEVITSTSAAPNTKNNSDVILTVTQDTADIQTYGTHETASVNIVTTQDDADIRCTTMLDDKPVDFMSSAWSTTSTLPYYGYEIITQPAPPNYTSIIHYGGVDYTPSDFPVLCKAKSWATAWIKDPNNNLVSYKNYDMNMSHLIYYQTVTVTCPIENTTISLKVNNSAVAGTTVYVWPGDVVEYTVSKTGYYDSVDTYTVPVLPNLSTKILVVDILHPLPATYTIGPTPVDAAVSLEATNNIYSGFSNSVYLRTTQSFTSSTSYKFITRVKVVHGTNWNTLWANHSSDYDFGLNSSNSFYWDVYGGGTSLNYVPENNQNYWIALVRDNSTYSAYVMRDTGSYRVDTLPDFQYWTLLKSATASTTMFNGSMIDLGNWHGSNYPWLGSIALSDTKIWSDGVVWFDGSTAVSGVDFIDTGCTITNQYAQEGNSVTVPSQTDVDWIVAKYGYLTQYGTKTVTITETDNVTLEAGDDSTPAYMVDSDLVVGDKVKVNDGMATNGTYKWSAYKTGSGPAGNYTQEMVVTNVDTQNNMVNCAGRPGPSEYDATVETGKIYHAYTYTDMQTSTSESVYTTDDPIDRGTFNLDNATNNGCTDNEDGTFTGGSGKYLLMSNILDTQNANTWDIKLCYTHNTNPNNWNTIVGQTTRDYSGFTLNVRSNGRLEANTLASPSSWIFADVYLNLTMQQGTTYYMIFGYDGTQYYFKYNTTAYPTALEEPVWTYTSITKNYQIDPLSLLGCAYYSTSRYNSGSLNLAQSSITIDGVVTTFGHFTSPSILYDNTFAPLDPQPEFEVNGTNITIDNNDYIQTPANNLVEDIASTISLVDNTTINDVTINIPTQGYNDFTFHAYTPGEGATYYATDDPISLGKFTLSNASVVGTLTQSEGVYSGFSQNNYIQLNSSTPITSLEFVIAFTPTSTSPGDILRTQPDGAGILLRNAACYLSSTGSGWNVLSGFSTGLTYTSDVLNYIKITWNSTDGIYTFWQSLDGENWTEKNSSDSGRPAIYWNNTQTIGACSSYSEYYSGSVDITKSYITIDGVTTNFGSFSNSSILYDANCDPIEPQPVFEKSAGNIIINDVVYIRNSELDFDQRIYSDPVITTSADVTTINNNMVIEGGAYHLFNLTVPQDKTAIIQSGGIEYASSDLPLLLKADTGVTLLLKDNDTIYYRNSWSLNKDYDLHYQQINFTYPENATVTCKVNNVLQSNLTPYCYAGDTITWTCNNAGTVTTGTYTVTYSAKDGNIQTIAIS